MRNGLTGLASAALLGAALAMGGASLQERSASSAAETDGDAIPKQSAAYVVTPDTIDCTTFITDNACETNVVVRAPQKAPARTVRLAATLTTSTGRPVDPAVLLVCSGCERDTVDLKDRPAVPVRVQLTFDEGWRRGWPPQVASGVLGSVSEGRYEGTPKRLRVLAPSPSRWQMTIIF